VTQFYRGEFAAAAQAFTVYAQQGDAVETFMAGQCPERLADPPPSPWDGAIVLHSK